MNKQQVLEILKEENNKSWGAWVNTFLLILGISATFTQIIIGTYLLPLIPLSPNHEWIRIFIALGVVGTSLIMALITCYMTGIIKEEKSK